MGVKNYTFSGIRIEAMQITPPMSEADSAGLSKWIGEHNVNVTVEASYDIGTAILVESEGKPFEYSFYMYPGDWLAYDGDIFFHITDDVFRKHYREITGKKVTDQGDTVVYATGGILSATSGIDLSPFLRPIYTPVNGLISSGKLPPVKIVTGGKAHQPSVDAVRKARGGATMKAAYLDEMDTVNRAHQPFIDAIRKAQDKAKADAAHKKAKDALDAAEIKQQATETDMETYRRHMKLLDLDGHAEHCSYCKDSTRNTVPPAFNKALADAVDREITNMTHHRGASHLHMDSDGKITPARRLSEELKRDWAFTHTIKTTPRPHTTAERTAEWRAPLETLAMYYNDFTPKAKPTPKKKHTQRKEAKKTYDSIHSYLDIIKELADAELHDSPAIRGLADQAKRELDHLHPNLKGPNA